MAFRKWSSFKETFSDFFVNVCSAESEDFAFTLQHLNYATFNLHIHSKLQGVHFVVGSPHLLLFVLCIKCKCTEIATIKVVFLAPCDTLTRLHVKLLCI